MKLYMEYINNILHLLYCKYFSSRLLNRLVYLNDLIKGKESVDTGVNQE